jgi:hypothetical protein
MVRGQTRVVAGALVLAVFQIFIFIFALKAGRARRAALCLLR